MINDVCIYKFQWYIKNTLRCEFKIIQKLNITFLQINALTDILCVVKEFIAKTQSRSGPLGSICFWFRCTQPNSNQSLRCTTARKLSSCISNFAFVAIDTNWRTIYEFCQTYPWHHNVQMQITIPGLKNYDISNNLSSKDWYVQ